MGEGDVNGVEADERWICGDWCAESSVGCITRLRASNEYFEPSLRIVAAHGGSASCPANRGLRELVECEGTGSS